MALVTLLTLCTAEPVTAGSTDPVLALGRASVHGDTGAAQVELIGTWAFDDVLQVDFPLSAVVSQGSTFARFPVGNAAEGGTLAQLDDGLQASEVAMVEAAGTPTADGAIVTLEPHRMRLALPTLFTAGALSVRLYVVLPGEGTFLSNELVVSLPAEVGA